VLLCSRYSHSQVIVDPNTGTVNSSASIAGANNSVPVLTSTATTDNLINKTGWTGITYTNNAGVSQCCTGGPGPAMNQDTNTMRFSYGFGIAQQAIAINTALAGKGKDIYVSGFNYSFLVDNEGQTSGYLSAAYGLTNSAGNALESYKMNLTGNYSFQKFSGTQNFSTIYSASSLGNLYVAFAGQDDRFWAGYYGPRVRDPSLSLNYGIAETSSGGNGSGTVNPGATVANQATQAAGQSTAIFASAATTDTSSTDNKSTGSQTVGGVGISNTGNINTLGNSVPSIVSNSNSSNSSNTSNSQPTQQSQPAPAQSQPAPAGPTAGPSNSPVQQAGPANNQPNSAQQAKAPAGPNPQQGPAQQAKAGPNPQQNQPQKNGPQPGGPNEGKPGSQQPGQPGGPGPNNRPQDMAMQVLDNMNAQNSANATSQDMSSQSQAQGSTVDALSPYKAQNSVVNNTIVSKNLGPVTASTSTALSSQPLVFANQQQSTQQAVQQVQQQQALSLQSTQMKSDLGAFNLVSPTTTSSTTSASKLAGDPTDPINQSRPEMQTATVEQKTDTVKKNVEPNDLAANSVSIASMATQPVGYDMYGFSLKDVAFYAPKEIYKNQTTIDNVRALRQLSSDRLHQEMIDQQYKGK
jgi:hypothetical protein